MDALTDGEGPDRVLVDGIVADDVGVAIVAQEHRGQVRLVESSLIPTDLRYDGQGGELTEERLVELGFKLEPTVQDDSLFREVDLPEGWTRAGTDHDLWSKILDETGTERMSIFYKAAYYDRDAFMSEVRVKR